MFVLNIFLSLLVFLVLFKIFYGQTELLVFPFIAQVWGTASDWIMVFITFISAVYIVKTLNEQKNINKASLLPIFRVEEQPQIDSQRGCLISKLRLVKNSAYYFAAGRVYGDFSPGINKLPILSYLAEGDMFEIEWPLNLPKEGNQILTLMTFSFRDVSHNLYWQDITYGGRRMLYSFNTPSAKK